MKAKDFSYLWLFSLLCCCAQAQNDSSAIKKYHNRIDDISSAKQIEQLLKSIDDRYTDFAVSDTLKFDDADCQHLCDSLKIPSYTKADFDNNGYTDLLVIGTLGECKVLCVMDSGNNRFYIRRLTKRNFLDCEFPVITTNEKETLIHYYNFKKEATVNPRKIVESKTLVFKFGGFIEYHDSAKNYQIKKIAFQTSAGYDDYIMFALTINADRTATYESKKYSPKSDKILNGLIDEQSYSALTGLLNYIDFPTAKDDYNVDWTDDQTSNLSITYNNGKVKNIRDFGLIGTYGLNRVYNLLLTLTQTQNWK